MHQSMIQFIAVVCFLVAAVRADDVRDMINVRDSAWLDIAEESDTAKASSIPQLRSIITDTSQVLPIQFSQTAQDSEASASGDPATNDDSETGIDAEQDQEIINVDYVTEVDNEFEIEETIVDELEYP